MQNFKSGFAAIIGKPNVGKSTLLNIILGEKLSIVSPKPQTTRQAVKGVYSDEVRQIVFLDTPGFLQPKYLLQEKMLKYLFDSLEGVDIIIFITDAKTYPTDYDEKLLEIIKNSKVPKIALLNKVDLVQKPNVEKGMELLAKYNFETIMPASFTNFFNVPNFIKTLDTYLPFGQPFYNPEDISDQGMRFFAQEIIREKIFLSYSQEIPYSTTVVVENYNEDDSKVEIIANIWLERASQKPIVLGKNGDKIKKIRIEAEKEIHSIVGKRVKLHLWIKIKHNWRKKKNALKEFGFK